jgi:sulfide:quinone oxidoreductase
MSDETGDGTRVVIGGGGVAGVEALLALGDLAGDRVSLTMVAPDPDFVYKPLLVEEPFGLGPPEQYALAPLVEEHGGVFALHAVSAVRPDDHEVELDDGSILGYDYLVVCVGGRFEEPFAGAVTFPSQTPLRIEPLLDQAVAGSGRIAFVVPPSVTWSLPIYEVALMTERRARERGDEVKLALYTPESAPLAPFGTTASARVAEMLKARGIEIHPGSRVHPEGDGLVITPGGEEIRADVVISLPVMIGPSIPGLPADDGGFIPVDEHSRVAGLDDVYAAGDGTNFPLKQGGLATQQADAAAEHIAHRLGAAGSPEPFHPVLRGQLLTGDASVHMRTDVTGGAGEGTASLDYLWWPPHKISGRYLSSMLQHSEGLAEAAPVEDALDVEVSLPVEWHEEPMAIDPHGPPKVD